MRRGARANVTDLFVASGTVIHAAGAGRFATGRHPARARISRVLAAKTQGSQRVGRGDEQAAEALMTVRFVVILSPPHPENPSTAPRPLRLCGETDHPYRPLKYSSSLRPRWCRLKRA